MAKPVFHRGFSLVEMMVALVFTMILMAGMAAVFKSSLSSFYTAGEKLASVRRNRSSIDLLYDDLNSAGMFLGNLTIPTGFSSTNPAFYILPNMAIDVSTAGASYDGPTQTDELFFYFDEPMAFEGTLASTGDSSGSARTASNMVLDELKTAGTGAPTTADATYTIECGDSSYAKMIQKGQYFIFKDFFEPVYISSATPTGTQVKVVAGSDPTAKITGSGSTGAPEKSAHIPGAGIVFYQPGQMVKYSIQVKNLDPQNANCTPCLIREQGNYSSSGFVADATQTQIISENISAFKVYLSADSGQTWAGYGLTDSGFSDGWTNGILKGPSNGLNHQLATYGRADFTSVDATTDPAWFRSIPTVVRLDITSRTASKRSEYLTSLSSTAATKAGLDYKYLTQSLVVVPRHFGLAMK